MKRTQVSIFIFWVPLAATWVMMASEGPFLTAIIARLGDPTYNLAAFGVAFAFGILFGTGIILLLIPTLYMILEDIRRLFGFSEQHSREHSPTEETLS